MWPTIPADVVAAAKRIRRSQTDPGEGGMTETEMDDYFGDDDPAGFGPASNGFTHDASLLADWVVKLESQIAPKPGVDLPSELEG